MTKVILHSFQSSNSEHRSFAEKAVELLNKIVESAEFYNEIEKQEFRHSGRRLDDGRYVSATTPAEVVAILQMGKELSSNPDGTLDLTVNIKDFPSKRTLGAVYPPSPIIYTNRYWVNRLMTKQDTDPVSLAAHWIHEWLHVAGFRHKRWEKRDVPYMVGNLASLIGKEIYSRDGNHSPNFNTLGLDYIIASAEANSCDCYEDEDYFTDSELTNNVAASTCPVIDIHTHTFNASDLSVEGFLADVVFESDEKFPQRLFDALVRFLARLIGKAPDAESEIRRLEQRSALEKANFTAVADELDQQFSKTSNEEFDALLEGELHNLSHSWNTEDQELFDMIVEDSELNRVDFDTDSSKSMQSIKSRLTKGFGFFARYIRWIRRLRRYRYEIVKELLNTYGQKNGVDLFISAQVDFGRWLKNEPKTPFDAQVKVAERITRELPGRIHFLAAYDPWRESEAPNLPHGSLLTVQRAVEENGFIGVKLYPPMGFSALGNAEHDFTAVGVHDEKFGKRLDSALMEFYGWAEKHAVPVMAHCNSTNNSKQGYEKRASPEYWEKALDEFPNLHLNLGHFGGQSNLGKSGKWPAKIIELMAARPYVYADIGMFNVHDDQATWFKTLKQEIVNQPILASRLMYGSDWLMLAKERFASRYFSDFKYTLSEQLPDFRDDILGGNAMRFLGLDRDSDNAKRLRTYYKKRQLAIPAWLKFSQMN